MHVLADLSEQHLRSHVEDVIVDGGWRLLRLDLYVPYVQAQTRLQVKLNEPVGMDARLCVQIPQRIDDKLLAHLSPPLKSPRSRRWLSMDGRPLVRSAVAGCYHSGRRMI